MSPSDSNSAVQAAPRRLPWTVRVATWSARHRWLVFGLWFVLTIGTFALSRQMGGISTQGATGGNSGFAATEASQGLEVLERANQSRQPGEPFVAVISLPDGSTPEQLAAVAKDAVAKLEATAVNGTPVFTAGTVIDPTTAPAQAGLLSPDGTSAQVPGRIPDDSTPQLDAIRTTLDALRAAHPDADIHSVSFSMINDDINAVVFSDLDRSLLLTIPITFVILLIAFGAFAASVVPLILALTSLLGAFGLLGIYSQLLNPVSPYATQLVVLIGLAVAIDYSLFMITRFRSERRRGHDTLIAIEIASSTAGRAVFFSGLAVMISVAALFVLPDELFHSMALGTIVVILISVIGSLTFLPAVLAILGPRIDFGRVPYFGRERPETGGVWSRIVTAVMKRPLLAAIASTAFLLFLAWPAVSLRLGTTDITAFPESVDGVVAIEQLRDHWPQGSLLTLDAIVTNVQDPQVQAAIAQLQTEGLTIPGLSQPVKVTPSADGTVADVSFVMAGTENDPQNAAIVREMRSRVVPALFGSIPNTRVYISGDAAASMDRTDIYTGALPEVFAFVLGLSFLLLLIAFRSIVIPIKAILLNLLSTAAAYGVLVAVFEQGFAKDLLAVRPTEVIEAWVPIFIFAILFGLSMDYHVFILSRVKELVDRGMATTDAVAKGIAMTAGTVTSAAAIMVVVFAVFATLRLVIIRELGLGLAVAVLIDATIIRSILLPATMRLLGEWNWYLPRWLEWLPKISLEVERDEPALGTESAAGEEAGATS